LGINLAPLTVDIIEICNYICSRFSRTFFGRTPNLDGGCHKITLTRGDVLFMPAGMIHFVHTAEESVVAGFNFLTRTQLSKYAAAYVEERKQGIDRDHCYPNFEAVGMLVLMTELGWHNEPDQDLRELYAALRDHNDLPALILQLQSAVSQISK
jgi:hypothetical protein